MKKALVFVLVLALIAAGAVPVWAETALPGDLVTISESAFENDANLTGLWVCPQNVQTIGANAFSGTNLFALDVNGGAVSSARICRSNKDACTLPLARKKMLSPSKGVCTGRIQRA